MKKFFAAAAAALICVSVTTACVMHVPNYEGVVLKVASTEDISAGSLADGATEFCEKYGCEVLFTDDFSECDLIYSCGEDFSTCMPITEYVGKRNRLYTWEIIENSCKRNGEIYGITNVLLGNINYCVYYPEQFGDVELPYERFKRGRWSWDGFIEMTDGLDGNVSVDWLESYINMRYALSLDKSGNTVYDYGAQKQVEWLNFVRTLIYDKGIVENTEGAYKVGFLPELILNSVADEGSRFVPLPSKNGKLTDVFVDEYHFCVPKNAKNPKLSIKLADAMIKSCRDTRLNLYRGAMTDEDFKLFVKQLKKIYTYPAHSEYVPAESMLEDFVHGKTVTEHIFNVQNGADHIK